MQIEVANVALSNCRATSWRSQKRSPSHLKFNEFLPEREVLRLRMNNRRQQQDDWEWDSNWQWDTVQPPMSIGCRWSCLAMCHMQHMPQRRLHYEWFGQQIATNCLQFKLNSISAPFPALPLPLLVSSARLPPLGLPPWHPLLAPWRMCLKIAINCACPRRQ